MKEIRVQFVESDVEHVIAGQTPCKQGEHHIEIITNGGQKLVFIDGKRLHRVLDIDVPLTAGEISPAITIKLHPDKITVRNVDGPQFKRIMKGEAIIPGRDNAALSQGDVVTPTLGWADELPSKPSKRELLEQILAEQRKTNGLLTRMLGDQRAIRLAIEVPLQSLQAIRFVDPAAPPACPASSGLPGLSPLDSGQSSR